MATLLLGCGSVQQVCDDYATAWCSAHYRCATGAVLANLQSLYGQTAADCVVVKENSEHFNCNGASAICAPGTSYDTGAGETCVSDTNKAGTDAGISCTDVLNDVDPPSCSLSVICH